MSASGSSSTMEHSCTDATTQTPQTPFAAWKEQERHLGVQRLGAIEGRARGANPNGPLGTPYQLFRPCNGEGTRCRVGLRDSETQFESSCSQRWHRRVTAALCVAGVTLSFVILALGLLFGGGLGRGPRYPWKNARANASANASSPNPGGKPEMPLPNRLNKLEKIQ
ncbi:uncharacterized protein [Dermacentor albipictus]|uniref:uncharacterized protein isoform X2 n=1 Tax=Dermacentor albipictus TaxID=60249 RepID=UPI0031FDFAAA